jgi:GT2 family glycosyltransferase
LTVAVCTYLRPESLARFLDSLASQSPVCDELVIVDASPGASSESTLSQAIVSRLLANQTTYVRVAGAYRGLTRQRNLALRLASREVIAFFDDDIVLLPGCLAALSAATEVSPQLVGVGASVTNEGAAVGWKWRALRLLRAVPDLAPGKYHRSGFVAPMRLSIPLLRDLEVDRLQGCSMAWRTRIARDLRFSDFFHGYSASEDIEFSRRAARFGRMIISAQAQVEHRPDPAGRPNQFQLARMTIRNRHYIHKTTLPDRCLRDVLWLAYASSLNAIFMAAGLARQGRLSDAASHLLGCVFGAFDRNRRDQNSPANTVL